MELITEEAATPSEVQHPATLGEVLLLHPKGTEIYNEFSAWLQHQ
jgi:hypothetical protein